MGLELCPITPSVNIYFQLLKQASVHFVRSISRLSVQPRIQPESWFASRCSRRESVVHCWRRPPKPPLRPVTRRTEELLYEGLLRDSLPLHAIFFVFLKLRWGSCTTLFHRCSADSPRSIRR